jgi:hypothetical protein
MTETELKHRLSAAVDDVDAPSDLVLRVRQGGKTRLRGQRLKALAVTGLALAVIGGAGIAVQHLPGTDPHPNISTAGGIGAGDPYGFMMEGPTQGDLAGDRLFQQRAVALWNDSHAKSVNQSRGIFDDLRGGPKVYWAGNTPAGKAAIVVQQSYLHEHENIQIDKEGIHTLVGYIGTGADGQPKFIDEAYPAPGTALSAGFVTGPEGKTQALVVLDLGRKMGWASKREYTDAGGSTRKYTPLTVKDGVSVVKLPAGTNPDAAEVSVIPPAENEDYYVANGRPPATSTADFDYRLWKFEHPDGSWETHSWALTDGADALQPSANDDFVKAVETLSDPSKSGVYMPAWVGYGITANGSKVLLSELQIDPDPTHLYAVVTPANGGKPKIVPGGVPDPKATLPVQVKLPDGQGWAVAANEAKLSYRFGTGAWSTPRDNAVLVPGGVKAEVKVTLKGIDKVVPLR